MNELVSKIQATMNTLEGLEIQSKRDTMLKLLGCLQVLGEVRDALRAPAQDVNAEVETDADDHAG